MAITHRQIGVGVGGASLGLVGAEGIQHAQEADLISDLQGRFIAGGVAAASLGLTVGSLTGFVPIGPEATALVGGAGLGSTVWYTARETGLAPRLTVDVPDEVNLADPLVTAGVISVVGIAVGTAASQVL